MKDVTDAEEVILDRWTVVFHSDEATNKSDYPSALSISTSSGAAGTEDNAAIFVMNNYLGIGLDADLCLGFHNAREENPDKFNSRFVNQTTLMSSYYQLIIVPALTNIIFVYSDCITRVFMLNKQ